MKTSRVVVHLLVVILIALVIASALSACSCTNDEPRCSSRMVEQLAYYEWIKNEAPSWINSYDITNTSVYYGDHWWIVRLTDENGWVWIYHVKEPPLCQEMQQSWDAGKGYWFYNPQDVRFIDCQY